MAIFSRRTLQRLINENADFLKPSQVRDHVNKLNIGSERSLDTEWEALLLNIFSKLGSVTHEPQLPGITSRPDIHFKSSQQNFIADIACISDKGTDELNPVQALYDRLMRTADEKGLRGNSFGLNVEGNHKQILRGKTKPKLKIPPRSRFDQEVFNDSFYRFVDAICSSPLEKRVHSVETEQLHFTISYDPSQPYATMSHLGFTGLTFIDQNTIYNRLLEKAQKLIGVEESALLGVMLCDGDCEALRSHRHFASYHVDDVVHYFLERYPEICFVFTFLVVQQFGHNARNEFATAWYVGRSHSAHVDKIEAILREATQFFPEPERDATNAKHLLNSRVNNEGDSFIGGVTMSGDEIKISARAVMDLLSGRLSQQDFLEAHNFVPTSHGTYIGNPFEYERQQGRLIREVTVESGGERRDDDWLRIRFGESDPAISPFRVPTTK